MLKSFRQLVILTTILAIMLCVNVQASVNPSYSENLPVDTVPFYSNANYIESVPKPNDYLSEPVGFWPLRYHELENYIQVLAASSDRVKFEVAGETHEGRKLYNVFIGTEENIAKLEQIKEQMDKLADPKQIKSDAELSQLVEDLPATAWLGYSIHGDEISGVDAAIQLIYHLAAATDSTTMHLLNNVVIIIHPSQNPDGRERYLSMLQVYRSHTPNYDRRSQQHSGVWPWGRGNHYLFDMNRDWILVTQPETKARTKTIIDWHPQLVVDAHEMGTNDTYLFNPPRQPINYNTPEHSYKWWDKFQFDQGQAFDERGWPYYTGEWFEQWYPGYGDAWPSFFGTIGILYEQSGVDGSFVKQYNDYLMTYHESVNHQFTSSLANLYTLANNKIEIMKDYHYARKKIVSDGQKSKLSFLYIPDDDEIKMSRFVNSLIDQGIEVERAKTSFVVNSSEDIFKKSHKSKKFPEGTYIVRTAQPHGALAKAVLEFDPHLKLDFLKEERRELEKHGDTKMYEVSTWSVSLAYNLNAYQTNSAISVATEILDECPMSTGMLHNPDATYAFVINMVGEKTYLAMNKIFGKGLVAYASEKPFAIGGNKYKAGSIVLRKRGNKSGMARVLSSIAEEVGIDIYGVNTGIASDGSYFGAGTYNLLREPRVAILSGDPLSTTSFGALWFPIDKQLNIPHSLIDFSSLAYANLSEYNVLVMASSWGGIGSQLGKAGAEKIKKWVSDGGTLITVGNASVWAADSTTGLSQVRLKRQSLEKLDKYKTSLMRELNAEAPSVDTMALFHPEKVAAVKKEEKEKEKDDSSLGKKEAEELDEWQRRFSPGGVMLLAELDKEKWLSFGMKKQVPVMLYTSYAFLSEEPVNTVARFTTDKNKLRLSGLLWPEARERWVGTSYVTQESKGRGQIIMFADHPNNRAYFYGTRTMFINAVLYGPGMGTSFEGPYNREH